MSDQILEALHRAADAQQAGDHAGALREHLFIHADCGHDDPVSNNLRGFALYEWARLAQDYPPALDALVTVRDEEVQRLLAGDVFSRIFADGQNASRWREVVRINDTLGDLASTHRTFVTLLDRLPEVAQRESRIALPALIAQHDFALAGRFLPDALAQASRLNEMAADLPLLPAAGEAPRLAAELMGYVEDVTVAGAILEGLERQGEAASLRADALAALSVPALRALAQQELQAPGAIMQALADHELATYGALPDLQ